MTKWIPEVSSMRDSCESARKTGDEFTSRTWSLIAARFPWWSSGPAAGACTQDFALPRTELWNANNAYPNKGIPGPWLGLCGSVKLSVRRRITQRGCDIFSNIADSRAAFPRKTAKARSRSWPYGEIVLLAVRPSNFVSSVRRASLAMTLRLGNCGWESTDSIDFSMLAFSL